jgi:DNA-binding LytR/AlgR family response regulator
MKQKTILLVEDDFLNRRLSKKILLENGFSVLEAKNAKETLEILKKESLDMIILDIHLGEEEQGGISIGQHIKDKYSIPFIYLTAYENPEIIGKAVATKPYSYLTKPFKNVDLITAVEIAFSQSAGLAKYISTILVKSDDYNVELPIDEIDYIESDGNYLLFYTNEKVFKSRSTIKQVLEELPNSRFVQTHRAYVINKVKIEKFNKKSLVIKNTEIPISKNFLDGIYNNIQ